MLFLVLVNLKLKLSLIQHHRFRIQHHVAAHNISDTPNNPYSLLATSIPWSGSPDISVVPKWPTVYSRKLHPA